MNKPNPITEKKIQELRERFPYMRTYIGEVNFKSIEKFLASTIPEVQRDAKSEVLKKLKKVDAERWNDAKHCSCLGHAIWKMDKTYTGGSQVEPNCEEKDNRCKPCQLENNLGRCDRRDCSNYVDEEGKDCTNVAHVHEFMGKCPDCTNKGESKS